MEGLIGSLRSDGNLPPFPFDVEALARLIKQYVHN